MEFKAGNTGGSQKTTEWKTRDSDFALMASNTVTIFGQTLVLKALSNAPIHKTSSVTFYSNWTDGVNTATNILGTSTFVDNISSVLVVPDLEPGINQVYAIWEGEGVYASKSTAGSTIEVYVNAGNPLGGNFYLSTTPANNTLVAYEQSVTLHAEFTTSTNVNGSVRFYNNGIPIGSVAVSGNQADLVVPYLTPGNHKLQASWPGGVIGSKTYAGVTDTINYYVLTGSYVAGPLTLSLEHLQGTVLEGNIVLTAEISHGNQLPGNIAFYKDGTLVGTVAVGASNRAILTLNNVYPVGSYNFVAEWDGNQGNIPAYQTLTSNIATWNVVSRATIPSMSLTVTPDESVALVQDAVLTATLNTSTTVNGYVSFYSNIDNLVGTATIIANVATLDTYDLSTGTHLLYAHYSGSTVEPKYYSVASDNVEHLVTAGFTLPYNLVLTSNKSSVYTVSTLSYTVSNSGNIGLTGLVDVSEFRDYTTQTATYSNVSMIDYSVFRSQGMVGTPYVGTLTYKLEYNNDFIQKSALDSRVTHSIEYTSNPGLIIDGQRLKIYLGTRFGYYDVVVSPSYNYGGSQLPNRHIVYLSFAGADDIFSRMNYNALSWYSTASSYGGSQYGIAGTDHWQLYYQTVGSEGYTETRSNRIPSKLCRGEASGQANNQNRFGTVPSVSGYQTTYWKTDKNILGSADFNGSSSLTFIVDASDLLSNTSTHSIRAEWVGGFHNTTPYLGKTSNVLTQTSIQSTVSLSSSNNPNIISEQNTFTAVILSDSVNGKTVTFKDGETVKGVVISVGSTATLTIPSYNLTVGTHQMTATVDGIVSNTLTQTIILPTAPSISLTTIPAELDNIASELATAISTSTIRLVGSYRYPTGTVKLYNASTNALLGSGTLSGSGLTSTVSISFNIADAGLASAGTKTLRANYENDNWNLTTSTNSAFTISNIVKTTPTLSSTITTSTYEAFNASGSVNPTALSITANLSGNRTGRTISGYVIVKDRSLDRELGRATIIGNNSYTISWDPISNNQLSAGLRTIDIIYTGDNYFSGLTVSQSVTVTKYKPTLSLSLGASTIMAFGSVLMTATKASTHPATYSSFRQSGTVVSNPAFIGNVSTATLTPQIGTFSITASTVADNYNEAATSPATTLTVTKRKNVMAFQQTVTSSYVDYLTLTIKEWQSGWNPLGGTNSLANSPAMRTTSLAVKNIYNGANTTIGNVTFQRNIGLDGLPVYTARFQVHGVLTTGTYWISVPDIADSNYEAMIQGPANGYYQVIVY